MPPTSAGVLMYRFRKSGPQVLLVHPGGPVWKNKDEGAWSIPKGEIGPDEDPLSAARREFQEEIGVQPQGTFVELKPIKQKSGKIVHAWACQGDCAPNQISSSTFTMEWPPGSGRQAEFPEVDRAVFFDIEAAKRKINPAQVALLDELESLLSGKRSPSEGKGR